MTERKAVFIAIVGRPNVGKSSILNNLLGQKVAIVSSKPQTTRTKIMGVLTEGDVQLVFTDTPGFHKPKTKLGEKMIKAVDDSIGGVDSCLFVTEAKGEIRDAELDLLKKLKSERIPVVLAINKIDMLPDKQELMGRIVELTKLMDFDAVVPVSARENDGMDELKAELFKLAVPSEFFFPEDTLTDQPERVIASEMIREKLLHKLSDEIPHGIAVSIEKMKEREDKPIMDIDAVIYCEKESHKGIVIGKRGAMLKEISTNARHELEQFFGCKINLQCWVKVKEDWRNREGLIHNFGLD